ncbi:pentatricopeptide repeat-containing protein At5g19020, mitochondrial [Impatiens glandulifera]|uniref:pentatricopeptide repeat-containing protein At5g19020, mitochondrial n=1 Tax=Impatiens glandulifera TaxID=253017 RepID=UPI001FB0B68F|nr:pentatricopeptide repeat-containing protein At5g19020, mitochondrial [Impatiens glandulifera]
MNIASRPKLILGFSLQIQRWVSKVPYIIPSELPPCPQDQLQILLYGRQDSRRRDVEISVVSALKSCTALSSIAHGKQIHGLVIKFGLDFNTFIQNSLINMYAKCGSISDAQLMFNSCPRLDPVSCNIMLAAYGKSGQLNDARHLFDEMPCKGCVSYTTMILCLTQSNCFKEAIQIFGDMRLADVTPNEVTLSNVISAYSHTVNVGICRMVHALVKKLGLEVFIIISTNLVHVYSLCSSLQDARMLFDEIPEPNGVSWNAMLNGYTKANLIDSAMDLFEKIPVKDIVSWSTIIDGYLQLGRLNEALLLYREMISTGVTPNDFIIVDVLSNCAQSMALVEGQQFHCMSLKTGFGCYDFIQATIIHFYACCQKIDSALKQFHTSKKNHVASWNAIIAGLVRNEMVEKARVFFNQAPERDIYSWSSMISGYAQSEQPKVALELFHEMVAAGLKPNEITMVSVLSAIATLGDLRDGIMAHEYIITNSIPLNDNLTAAIIDVYAKCGSIGTALEIFQQNVEKIKSVSPWNAIICGLAIHGHGDLSLLRFSDLQKRGVKPNGITFVGVLSACCHVGKVEEGKKHFGSMKNLYGIEPNLKHYGCMVDLLGRAGRLEEAEEVIMSMPMEADDVIWGTLLAACKTYGNLEIGERAGEGLAKVQPRHGGGMVLLSSLYADAGKWEDAFLARRAIQSQGMKRSTAYSGVL